MKIWEYSSYEEYKERQTHYNKQKISWVYVKKHAIGRIFSYLSEAKKIPNTVICHGTRNGAEQKMFKEFFPLVEVIGSEISDTAESFPMTVQHDFTLEKEEWVGKFDAVYSNSFDHSIDPEQTLLTWKNQLTASGLIFLDYAEHWSVCQESDPLDATLAEVRELIDSSGMTIVHEMKGSQGGTILVLEASK